MADLGQELEQRPWGPDAQEFVVRALDFTLRELGEHRHVSGAELVEGIRRYALDEYGPMARHVLEHMGLRSTRDFGRVVFELVAQGILLARDDDRIEDFEGHWDFAEGLERGYFADRLDPGS